MEAIEAKKKGSGMTPQEEHDAKAAAEKSSRLEREAENILRFIAGLQPDWEVRINILRTDRGFTALQAIGAMVGKTLDAGEHTIIPTHPYFQTGYVGAGSGAVCPVCKKAFTPAYGGQPLCGEFACSAEYYHLKTAKDIEAEAVASRARREAARKIAMEKGLWVER